MESTVGCISGGFMDLLCFSLCTYRKYFEYSENMLEMGTYQFSCCQMDIVRVRLQ